MNEAHYYALERMRHTKVALASVGPDADFVPMRYLVRITTGILRSSRLAAEINSDRLIC